MRHTRFFAFIALSFSLVTHSKAQTLKATGAQIPFINSTKLLEKGVIENDSGNYKKALSYYEQIPDGDSNYLHALYELSISNLNDNNYVKAIDVVNKAIALKSPDKRILMLNMAAALDYSGKKTEAVKIYDSIIRLYPLDNHPYYEQAIIKYKAKDFAGAEKLLEQSLMLNPLHFGSHYVLGSTYAFEGKLTQAMMALSSALLCTSDYQRAKNPIAVLDAIAVQTVDVSKAYDERNMNGRDAAFDEIDDIVHSKLALDKGYKLMASLDDNIFRQLQVVMEKLAYDGKDPEFAMQFYVPLFTKIYKEDRFSPFVLHLFSNYGIKSIDKLTQSKKGKTGLEEVKNIIYPYLTKIFATKVLDYNSRQKAPEIYHQLEDNTILVATFSDPKQSKFAAGKATYYKDFNLSTEGLYDADGKKDGIWKYYYPSGNLRLTQEFEHNTLANADTAWYENGIIKTVSKYNNEGVYTEYKKYGYNGQIEYMAELKAKDDYDYTYYYASGAVRKKQSYVNDKVKDGTYNVYYESGELQKKYSFKNYEMDGPSISYYENGKINDSFGYVAGKINGICKSYYRNGNLEREYTYADGKKNGLCVDYRMNGNLYAKTNYVNGKIDGEGYFYSRAGKQFGRVTYKNGHALQSKYFNPDGTEIDNNADSANGYVDMYNDRGVLIRQLKVDKEGKQQGISRYYFGWGGLSEETNFTNGYRNGTSTSYYQNGNIKTLRQYKNDTLDGYYKSMYESGALKKEGWIKNGMDQGNWREYNNDGFLFREYYLLNDKPNGHEKLYESKGRIRYDKRFDRDMQVGFTQYDTSGKAIQELTFDKGNGKYHTLHMNGIADFECEFKYGKLNGPYTIHGGNKTLLEKGTYVNGKSNGETATYFPNGQLKAKGMYKDGQKDKTWTYYTIDGLLESITQYHNGDMDGPDSNFSGGRLISVERYRDNEADSFKIFYGENGKIAGIIYFDLGTVTGYTYEDKNGQLLPVTPIKNGAGHMQTFYANGNKGLDFTWEKNLLQGKILYYFSNGNMDSEIDYDKGRGSGNNIHFYPDGSKRFECHYKNGEKQGISTTYDTKGKPIFVVNFTDGQMNGNATYTDTQGKKHTYWYCDSYLEQ